MNEIQMQFLKLIHSRWGAFTQWAIGAIVGYLVSLAAKHGLTLSPDVQEFLTEGLTLGFAFLTTFAVQWYQSTQTQKLQKIIGTTPDGYIGPETIEAAKDL